MSKILHIETATDVCSVAWADGGKLLYRRETREGRSHARILTVFIDEILKEAGTTPDAVAVSKGPGSYTGLRIGVSAAKGLCYGLDIPLIGINTLDVMCMGYITAHPEVAEGTLLAPMIDARRMEVYTALFDSAGNRHTNTRAQVIDAGSFQEELQQHRLVLFGPGAGKLNEVLTHAKLHIDKDYHISADDMAGPAWEKFQAGEFEDVAYFEPFYLKDFITTTPKKNMLGI